MSDLPKTARRPIQDSEAADLLDEHQKEVAKRLKDKAKNFTQPRHAPEHKEVQKAEKEEKAKRIEEEIRKREDAENDKKERAELAQLSNGILAISKGTATPEQKKLVRQLRHRYPDAAEAYQGLFLSMKRKEHSKVDGAKKRREAAKTHATLKRAINKLAKGRPVSEDEWQDAKTAIEKDPKLAERFFKRVVETFQGTKPSLSPARRELFHSQARHLRTTIRKYKAEVQDIKQFAEQHNGGSGFTYKQLLRFKELAQKHPEMAIKELNLKRKEQPEDFGANDSVSDEEPVKTPKPQAKSKAKPKKNAPKPKGEAQPAKQNDKSFTKYIENKKFIHPDTKNKVKFDSLPEKDQERERRKWQAINNVKMPDNKAKKAAEVLAASLHEACPPSIKVATLEKAVNLYTDILASGGKILALEVGTIIGSAMNVDSLREEVPLYFQSSVQSVRFADFRCTLNQFAKLANKAQVF